MKRTYIKNTPQLIGKSVLLEGYVNRIRDHGGVVFVELRDKSGVVQCVGGKELSSLSLEYVLKIEGEVKKRPERMIKREDPMGEIEVGIRKFTVLSKSSTLPFDTGKDDLNLTLPTLLDYRALTLRHPKIRAIFELENRIVESFRLAMKENGFSEFHAPTIVPVATEGGSEVFPVSYYDYTVYLGQSPQLYKQMMVGVFEKVYSVARAYRAEPSTTTRHLSEYVSLDCEFGFIEDWGEIMDMAEKTIRRIFDDVDKDCKGILNMYGQKVPEISGRIPRIKLKQAQEIIFKRTGRDNRNSPDLDPEDEREICKWSKEKHGCDLVFITHYPTSKRPFYTYPDPADPEYTYSFDLLGRGLEWITGGQRINDYDQLVKNIKKWGNSEGDFKLYLQAFRYGMPPEGGFALGLERITMQILGLKNIREASLFPRDMERVDFLLSEYRKKTTDDKISKQRKKGKKKS